MTVSSGLPDIPSAAGSPTPLVRVESLTKLFPMSRGLFRRPSAHIHAVDDVSFELFEGESFGLVGESGCGKTTIGKLLVKLMEPTGGRILSRKTGTRMAGKHSQT